MTKVKQAYENTKYPQIFRETYWGSFKESDDGIKPFIYNNRNKFVEEFGIVKCYGPEIQCTSQDGHEMDHSEIYRTKDGKLVLIVSNYGFGPSIPMTGYHPLYNDGAVTYIRVFKDRWEYKRLLKKYGITPY